MINLITEYRTSKSDELFLLIYERTKEIRESKEKYFKSKGFSEHEITEGLDDALIECIEKWDENKSEFLTFYRSCADLRIIDARRKTIKKDRFEVYEGNEDLSKEGEERYIEFIEQDVKIHEFPSVVKEIKKLEQHQLLHEIIRNCDETLRQQLYIIADGHSTNYAATKFKMHHQTLNRKIDRISRKYSARWQGLSHLALRPS